MISDHPDHQDDPDDPEDPDDPDVAVAVAFNSGVSPVIFSIDGDGNGDDISEDG